MGLDVHLDFSHECIPGRVPKKAFLKPGHHGTMSAKQPFPFPLLAST